MMTSSNGNIFHVTSPLCGEFTGHRLIPLTKASDAEFWCSFFICACINAWVNSREAGDLRRHRGHYDVIVMACVNGHHSEYSPLYIRGAFNDSTFTYQNRSYNAKILYLICIFHWVQFQWWVQSDGNMHLRPFRYTILLKLYFFLKKGKYLLTRLSSIMLTIDIMHFRTKCSCLCLEIRCVQ